MKDNTKEQTAIMQLIEKLKKESKQDGLLESYKYGLTIAIRFATELLPVERKNGEDIWDAAQESAIDNSSVEYDSEPDEWIVDVDYSFIEKEKITYFTNKYNV